MRHVSVIIPSYNSAHCVSRAIRSALEQSRPPLEVLVIDDGSTDATESVVAPFEKSIHYLQQANAGPASARNNGLFRATGEYVAFLDADDYWAPDFLAETCAFLDEHSEVVAVSTGACFHRLDGSAVIGPPIVCENRHGRACVLEDFFQFWAEQDHIRTGSCVMRRRALIETAGQRTDLRLGEDLELWALLGTSGRWGFIPRVLWHCDSERMAVKQGWSHKYSARRRLCPTLEQWERRIRPRLSDGDAVGFRRVRGRVAAMLVQNQILAGDFGGGCQTFRAAGGDLPRNWLTVLLSIADSAGPLGWRLGCLVVCAREIQKSATCRWIARYRGWKGGTFNVQRSTFNAQ